MRNGQRSYKLQFVVSADHSVVVTSYANAPASVVSKEPLTFSASNPRGSRPMTVIWNRDNTMVISGPGTSGGTFHNEGACAKA